MCVNFNIYEEKETNRVFLSIYGKDKNGRNECRIGMDVEWGGCQLWRLQ